MDTLLIVIVTIYNIGFLICVLHILRTPDKGSKQVEEVRDIKDEDGDSIVGKSKFKMPISKPLTAKSTPLDATDEKGEDIEEMPATFASQTEEKQSAQVADEDLDRAFSDARSESSTSSYSDEDDDYDGVPNEAFAKGFTFEEIGESAAIAKDTNATEEQKVRAGRVFVEMEGTELYERLMANSEQWKIRIRAVSNSYLGAMEETPTKSNVKRKKFKLPTTMDEFNFRDYV